MFFFFYEKKMIVGGKRNQLAYREEPRKEQKLSLFTVSNSTLVYNLNTTQS